MAHSFVSFCGKDVRIHDLDLAIACLFVIGAYKKRGTQNAQLTPMFTAWMNFLSQGAPGCLDLRLDEYLSNPSVVVLFRSLLDEAFETVAAYPDKIPREVITSMGQECGLSIDHDYKLPLIQAALKDISSLLDE